MLKEIGKLDNMSSDQALLEENFLNRITALQLRIRRKVYQKFVNYTREQLVQQIKAVLKPTDEKKSVENLLLTILKPIRNETPQPTLTEFLKTGV